MKYYFKKRFFLFLSVLAILSACNSSAVKNNKTSTNAKKPTIDIEHLFRDDLSYAIEISYQQSLDLLAQLTAKLYKRNPNQLNKKLNYQIEDVVILIKDTHFSANNTKILSQLPQSNSTGHIFTAFNPAYKNDRILAFVYGLKLMINQAYKKNENLLADEIDAQKIYDLGRNFEIAFWQLFNSKDNEGKLYLITNNLSEPINLSYERLAGKLIAKQDLLAQLAAHIYGKKITQRLMNFSKIFYFMI